MSKDVEAAASEVEDENAEVENGSSFCEAALPVTVAAVAAVVVRGVEKTCGIGGNRGSGYSVDGDTNAASDVCVGPNFFDGCGRASPRELPDTVVDLDDLSRDCRGMSLSLSSSS